MQIRTFLARLDTSVVRYNTVLEGGVEFSIPCDDHVKGDDGDDGRQKPADSRHKGQERRGIDMTAL